MVSLSRYGDGLKAFPKIMTDFAKGLGRRYLSHDRRVIAGSAEKEIGIMGTSIFFARKRVPGFTLCKGPVGPSTANPTSKPARIL